MKIKMTNLSIYEWEQEKQAKEAGTWSETEAAQLSLYRDESEDDD